MTNSSGLCSNEATLPTFVTAFMNIYPKDDPYAGKDIRWRFERFFKLVETGIQICVYVDDSGEELLKQCVDLFPDTIRIMRVMNIYDTIIHKLCEQYGKGIHVPCASFTTNSEDDLWLTNGFDTIQLPSLRNKQKDTYEYMVLMNSKIEFMYDTIQKNPWNSTHFAWIDFNVAHVFKNITETQEYIKLIGNSRLTRDFLLMPGCWYSLRSDSNEEEIQKSVLNTIHWRFCGGFFIGDKQSIIQFYDLYQEYFPEFLFRYRHLTWEVNFWAWLEWKVADWNPIWFLADHDDSIVRIPYEYLSLCLAKDTISYRSQVYDYPIIEDASTSFLAPFPNATVLGSSFRPMSASVTILPNGHLGLNTRYVNYTLTDTGSYIFHHPDRVIITKNVFSYLDHHMIPTSFMEIDNPTELTSHPCLFHGIEDIRIWTENNHVKYIGTSVNYSPSGKNRIIYGKYDIQLQRLVESNVIDPPTDTYCEKNWTPVVVTGEKTRFVYKWYPMEIGTIDPETNSLRITTTYSIVLPIFKKLRGSTYFREFLSDSRYLIGLLHFSEKEWPRFYFHQLILLDKTTLQPVQCTQPFSFHNRTSIEFCIGFYEDKDRYHFWISYFDRDPANISILKTELSFCIKIV